MHVTLSLLRDAVSLKHRDDELEARRRQHESIHGEDDDAYFRQWIIAENGDRKKARKSYNESKRWRRENDIDHILERPHPHFRAFKETLYHKIVGYDTNGVLVVVERTGSLREKTNALRDLGLTSHDFATHAVYCTEYYLQKSKSGKMTKIIDLGGLSFSDLRELGYFSSAQQVMNMYPDIIARMIVVNAPSSFSFFMRILSPFLSRETKNKMIVQSTSDVSHVDELDMSNIPKVYGGDVEEYEIGSQEEREFWDIAEPVHAREGLSNLLGAQD